MANSVARPLRRYTELSFAIEYLATERLALLSPDTWDDRNDAHNLDVFVQRTPGVSNAYALCMTEAPETYHHWKIFSPGTSGVCILFNKKLLVEAAKRASSVQAKRVQYKQLSDLDNVVLKAEAIPFMKRYAFRDEREFRLVRTSNKNKGRTFPISVPRSAIVAVILSPWIPYDVAVKVGQTLRKIEGCSKLDVKHSTLVANQKWKDKIDGCA